MRTYLNLREWTESLRITGDDKETDFADEILELLDHDDACLCGELADELDAATDSKHIGEPIKQIEHLTEQANTLQEIKDAAKENCEPFRKDIDNQIRDELELLASIRELVKERGHEGDLYAALNQSVSWDI